jgi:hypothetical protein
MDARSVQQLVSCPPHGNTLRGQTRPTLNH